MKNRTEILEELIEIFRDIFEDDELILNENMTAEDIEDWDSLAHIRIIVAIEKQFSLKLSINEISSLKNIGDMINMIESKQGEN